MKNSWSQTSNFDMRTNLFTKLTRNEKPDCVESKTSMSNNSEERKNEGSNNFISPCCRNPSEIKSGDYSQEQSISSSSLEDTPSLYSGKNEFLAKWSSRDVQLLSTENSVYSDSDEESKIDNLTYNIVTNESSDEFSSDGEETYINPEFKNISMDEKGYSTESDSEELIKLERSNTYENYFAKILSELRSIKESLKRESIRNKVVFIGHPDISRKYSQKSFNEPHWVEAHEYEYRKIDNDSLLSNSKNMLQHLLWTRQGDNHNEKLETIVERKDLSTGSTYRYIEQ